MSATVEKKVALTIEMKGVGGQQIGQLTVNLKGLDDASKKAASSGEKTSASLEKIGKSFLGFLKLGLAIKAVKELGQAFQALISNSLAMQSSGSPLVAQFEAAASKIKVSAASIAGAALPAIDGMATAAGDATKEIADFVDTNRELIATNVVAWSVDSGRALVSVLATGANIANRSIHGLSDGYHVLKSAALGFAASIGEERGGVFAARAKELRQASDEALSAAIRGQREMEAFDGKLDALVSKAGTYLNKAEKIGLELAKKRPRFSDPEADAAAMAAKEREIARYLELAASATTKEQALNASTLAWFALNEHKKTTIAGETASTAIARQEAIADKIRAVNQLEVTLQAKFQAKYLADLGARADAQADYQNKLRGFLQSRSEYAAELEDKKSKDARPVPTSFLSSMMAAKKAQSFMGPKTEEQAEKEKKTLEDYADGVRQLAQDIGSGIAGIMTDAITSIASGSKSALEALGGMLGGIVSMLGQMLIQLGTAALVASALSAIPFFAPLVGGPGAAAAGAAAIVAGGIMIAAGAGISSAIGMESGGLVLGGSPNFDSVNVMLQRGEYVIPAQQVRENVRAGRAPDDSGASRGSGGAGVTIAVTQQSFVPGTKADFQRSVRDAVLPAISDLARAGLLRLR